MLKRHVFLAGLIVGSLALATPAYAGGSSGGRQGRDNPKHENPKQESPKHEDSKHEDSKHNDGNGKCDSWTESVRVASSMTNVNVGHEDIDFGANNIYVNGKLVESNIHFVAGITAVGFGSAYTFNSPTLPMSGRPHDRMMLNPTLTSGEIDTTIQVVGLLDGVTHTFTIRVHTYATVPAVFDSETSTYVRHDFNLSGYVLRDGQPWFDFDNPTKPTTEVNFNASTCAPRGAN
ncbi:MAG: hypothetical protein AB7L13_19285 [Acidimicrobiia bacterium]